MSSRLSMAPRLFLAAGVAALVAIGPVWSNSTWASTPRSHADPQSSKYGSLSGKWSGTYKGTFGGTFKLTWQESGQSLKGTIEISGFSNVPTSIRGNVRGSSISFGTVGTKSITYSGSVSQGNSMSGNWKMQDHGMSVGAGSWKASKSS